MKRALADLKAALGGIERERARGALVGFQQSAMSANSAHLHVRHRRAAPRETMRPTALALIDDVARGDPPAVLGNGEGAAEARATGPTSTSTSGS